MCEYRIYVDDLKFKTCISSEKVICGFFPPSGDVLPCFFKGPPEATGHRRHRLSAKVATLRFKLWTPRNLKFPFFLFVGILFPLFRESFPLIPYSVAIKAI